LFKKAKVYLAARNRQKAEEAIAALKEETKKEAIFLQLDLADLDSIKRTAEEFERYLLLAALFIKQRRRSNLRSQ
jgi:NAD(P)-dependent dehydrogenase (short-subunit alcohol dehydrogenase family)